MESLQSKSNCRQKGGISVVREHKTACILIVWQHAMTFLLKKRKVREYAHAVNWQCLGCTCFYIALFASDIHYGKILINEDKICGPKAGCNVVEALYKWYMHNYNICY